MKMASTHVAVTLLLLVAGAAADGGGDKVLTPAALTLPAKAPTLVVPEAASCNKSRTPDLCTQLRDGKAEKLGLSKFWIIANITGLSDPSGPLCNGRVQGTVLAPTEDAYTAFFKQACKAYYPTNPNCGFDYFIQQIQQGNALFQRLTRELSLFSLSYTLVTKKYVSSQSKKLPNGGGFTNVKVPSLMSFDGAQMSLTFFRNTSSDWRVGGDQKIVQCLDPSGDPGCNKGEITWNVLKSCGQVLHKISRIALP